MRHNPQNRLPHKNFLSREFSSIPTTMRPTWETASPYCVFRHQFRWVKRQQSQQRVCQVLKSAVKDASLLGKKNLKLIIENYANLNIFLSWGKSDFAVGAYQAIQKEVDVPIIDQNSCQNQLRLTRLGSNFQLDFISCKLRINMMCLNLIDLKFNSNLIQN